MKLVVTVCTRARPAQLRACLDSLRAAAPAQGVTLEIVVVENETAPALAHLHAPDAVPPVHYGHEKRLGVPMARNRSVALALALAAMTGMVRDMGPNAEVLRKAAGAGFATATDLADWCVRVLNIPFRSAHHITGSLVKMAEDRGCDLSDLSLADMQSVEPRITDDVFSVLTVEASVASRTSYGGTAPDNVRAQIARWKEKLG